MWEETVSENREPFLQNNRVDLVLVMSVNPGFGGQSFIDEALVKIGDVRDRLDRYAASSGRDVMLEVDGGVKVDNVAAIARAGACTFVAGSAVFGARDDGRKCAV